jgi:GntR family transcriptional regulator, carbon starvation induced regulator
MADSLNQLFESEPVPHAPPRTLVAEAYEKLRSDIVEGRLKAGEKLRTEHLKDIYQVGAATLREALGLLIADTLVVSQQQRGFRVAPMSVADFEDITETRAMLEAHAVRLSIQRGDDAWEAELSGAFHLLTRADERLRRAEIELIASCGSRWTRHFLSILYRQSERYRRLALVNASPERDVHQEHQAIFEAAMNREVELAGTLIEQHIRMTLGVVRTIPGLEDRSGGAQKAPGRRLRA